MGFTPKKPGWFFGYFPSVWTLGAMTPKNNRWSSVSLVLCCCWLGDRKGIQPVKKPDVSTPNLELILEKCVGSVMNRLMYSNYSYRRTEVDGTFQKWFVLFFAVTIAVSLDWCHINDRTIKYCISWFTVWGRANPLPPPAKFGCVDVTLYWYVRCLTVYPDLASTVLVWRPLSP